MIFIIPLGDVLDKIMLFDVENSSKIRDRALAYTKNLKYLFINKPTKEISNGAFKGCNKLYIKGHKNSVAESYAKEYDIELLLK